MSSTLWDRPTAKYAPWAFLFTACVLAWVETGVERRTVTTETGNCTIAQVPADGVGHRHGRRPAAHELWRGACNSVGMGFNSIPLSTSTFGEPPIVLKDGMIYSMVVKAPYAGGRGGAAARATSIYAPRSGQIVARFTS